MTESDDVDREVRRQNLTFEQLSEISRAVKESHNHQHQRATLNRGKSGKPSNNVIQFHKRQQRKASVSSDGVDEVVEVKPPIPELTVYVVPGSALYEIQGNVYEAIPHGYTVYEPVDEEGVKMNPVGNKIKVQSAGIGWFILSSDPAANKVSHVTTTSCTEFKQEGFSYRDSHNRLVHERPVTYTIYKPLWSYILKATKSSKLTDHVVSTLGVIISNPCYLVDGKPDHPVIISTVEAYKKWLFRRSILINNGETRRYISLNFDELGHHETQHALFDESWVDANHMIVERKFSAWTEESITTDMLVLSSWEPRDDFTVLINTGVDIDSGRFWFGEDVSFPKRFKVTKFFEFKGKGLTPFAKHTRNNENLSHACKRLIGKRISDEHILRQNSMRLAHWFSDRSALHTEILRLCVGNRTYNESLCTEPPVGYCDFIKDCFSYLQQVVCPTFVESIIDATKTKLHTAKYEALGWFYEHSPFHGRSLWAKIPHAKAKQREQFVLGRKLHYAEFMPLSAMTVCIKEELGKCGKPARLFINLDSESSYAPTLPMHIKVALHGTHVFRLQNVTVELWVYAQPIAGEDELNEIAEKMYLSQFLQDYLFVAIHSDDSCMVGNIHGKIIRCNNDVSSNDSGQDASAFFSLAVLQANFSQELALGLLKLACLPIDIRSPTSEAFLRLQFASPFEPSGHSNTSCWNHIGSILISLSICYYLVSNPMLTVTQCVEAGARLVGHVMTCEECDCLEKVQFLKFSPVFNGIRYVMSANLGRIFRKLGCVDGDLTHEQLGLDPVAFRMMTPEERMNTFWKGVILGLKNEPDHAILNALRTRFISSDINVTESCLEYIHDVRHDSYYMHSRTHETGDCTNSVMKRYGLSEVEVQELVAIILDLNIGQRWQLSSIAKMFKTDYGVGDIILDTGGSVESIDSSEEKEAR